MVDARDCFELEDSSERFAGTLYDVEIGRRLSQNEVQHVIDEGVSSGRGDVSALLVVWCMPVVRMDEGVSPGRGDVSASAGHMEHRCVKDG